MVWYGCFSLLIDGWNPGFESRGWDLRTLIVEIMGSFFLWGM